MNPKLVKGSPECGFAKEQARAEGDSADWYQDLPMVLVKAADWFLELLIDISEMVLPSL